jgi:hypothetical protein
MYFWCTRDSVRDIAHKLFGLFSAWLCQAVAFFGLHSFSDGGSEGWWKGRPSLRSGISAISSLREFSFDGQDSSESLSGMNVTTSPAVSLSHSWRRGRDSNPRWSLPTPVFKTGALNHYATSPRRSVLRLFNLGSSLTFTFYGTAPFPKLLNLTTFGPRNLGAWKRQEVVVTAFIILLLRSMIQIKKSTEKVYWCSG